MKVVAFYQPLLRSTLATAGAVVICLAPVGRAEEPQQVSVPAISEPEAVGDAKRVEQTSGSNAANSAGGTAAALPQLPAVILWDEPGSGKTQRPPSPPAGVTVGHKQPASPDTKDAQ